MDVSIALSLLTGCLYIVGYTLYNYGVLKGHSKPSSATWLIWSSIALVNMASYFKASEDWWKSVIPLLDLVLCALTFIIVFVRSKFKRPDFYDFLALLVAVAAVVIWELFGSATQANVVVNVAIAIGLIPTWRGIMQRTNSEHSLPWIIWTMAYVGSFVVVCLRWNGQWVEILYPINGFLLHLSVPLLLAIFKKVRTNPQLTPENL